MARIKEGFIKVIRTPIGPAPEAVRKAWVGLTLPMIGPNPGREVNSLNGKLYPKRKSFLVLKIPALEILEKKDPLAAKWFRENPGGSNCFAFGHNEIETLPAN